MDPFSIVTGSLTIVTLIGKLGCRITIFAREVREARHDLYAVKQELDSLATVLDALAYETDNAGSHPLPDRLSAHIHGILRGCEDTVTQIDQCVAKYDQNKIVAKGKWAAVGKSDVAKHRSSLESYKSALNLALDTVVMTVARDIKQDTTDIKGDTSEIKADVHEILELVTRLETLQRTGIQPNVQDNFLLRRHLEGLSTYVGSVYEESVAEVRERRASLDGLIEDYDEPLDNVPSVGCSPRQSMTERLRTHRRLVISADSKRISKPSSTTSNQGSAHSVDNSDLAPFPRVPTGDGSQQQTCFGGRMQPSSHQLKSINCSRAEHDPGEKNEVIDGHAADGSLFSDPSVHMGALVSVSKREYAESEHTNKVHELTDDNIESLPKSPPGAAASNHLNDHPVPSQSDTKSDHIPRKDTPAAPQRGHLARSVRNQRQIRLADLARAKLLTHEREQLDDSLRMITPTTTAAVVTSLLEKGADPNTPPLQPGFGITTKSPGQSGYVHLAYPLQNAVKVGNLECCTALLRFGALTTPKETLTRRHDSILTDVSLPPIHHATMLSQPAAPAIIDCLITEGANVNHLGPECGTPLTAAILACSTSKGPGTILSNIEHLLKLGADANLCASVPCSQIGRCSCWKFPLAVIIGVDGARDAPALERLPQAPPEGSRLTQVQVALIKLLRDHGATIDCYPDRSRKLLSLAIQYRLHSFLEGVLIWVTKSGASNNDSALLHSAADHLDLRAIEILMQYMGSAAQEEAFNEKLKSLRGLPIHVAVTRIASLAGRENLRSFTVRGGHVEAYLRRIYAALSPSGALYDCPKQCHYYRTKGDAVIETVTARQLAQRIYLPDPSLRNWLFPFLVEKDESARPKGKWSFGLRRS